MWGNIMGIAISAVLQQQMFINYYHMLILIEQILFKIIIRLFTFLKWNLGLGRFNMDLICLV